MKVEKINSFFKNNWYFLLLFPIIINSLVNSILNGLDFINYYSFFSTTLLFFLLIAFGISIKNSIGLNSLSFSISLFLISFFVFNSLALFLNQNISFRFNVYLVLLIWIVYFFLKKIEVKIIISNFIIYLLNIFFNQKFLTQFEKNPSIEVDVWYYIEFSKNIYDYNYFYSMNNAIFAGYSQFSSYMQSVLYSISFNQPNFIYYRSTTNVLFFLFCLLLFETSKDLKIRCIMIALFSSLVINSRWLEFLMYDSLMSEGIMNFLFTASIVALFKEKSKKLVFTVFGLLIFSKQFYILLVLGTGVIFFLFKKYRNFIPYLYIGLLGKEIIYLTYFKNLSKDHHIRQIDLVDTLLDLILFRDLNINNFKIILKNIYIDKPFSYLILSIFLIYLINLYKKSVNFEINYYFMMIFSNFSLIILLYISAWREMELESPYRFILNLFLLKLIFLTKNLEAIKK